MKKTRGKKKKVTLKALNRSVFRITEKEMSLGKEKLQEITKKHDYVTFDTKNAQHLPYKEYFQIYSLLKSGKKISCCNYYVHSLSLGDYLLFFTRDGAALLDKETFNKMLDINQLMVTRDYLLENYDSLSAAFYGKTIDFVNNDTSAFVAMPLVRISKPKTRNYQILKKAFGLKFMYRLYASYYQRRMFVDPFVYALLVQGCTTNPFILDAIKDTFKDKNLWAKVKRLKLFSFKK